MQRIWAHCLSLRLTYFCIQRGLETNAPPSTTRQIRQKLYLRDMGKEALVRTFVYFYIQRGTSPKFLPWIATNISHPSKGINKE